MSSSCKFEPYELRGSSDFLEPSVDFDTTEPLFPWAGDDGREPAFLLGATASKSFGISSIPLRDQTFEHKHFGYARCPPAATPRPTPSDHTP